MSDAWTPPKRRKNQFASETPEGKVRVARQYLIDQIREEESLQDFRSIKDALLTASDFQIGRRNFHFARVVVETKRKR